MILPSGTIYHQAISVNRVGVRLRTGDNRFTTALVQVPSNDATHCSCSVDDDAHGFSHNLQLIMDNLSMVPVECSVDIILILQGGLIVSNPPCIIRIQQRSDACNLPT